MAREPAEIVERRRALGRRLAGFRRAAHLTQAELAHRLHYQRASLSNIENGHQPSPRQFWQRADIALAAGGVLLRDYEQLVAAKQVQSEASREELFGELTRPVELDPQNPHTFRIRNHKLIPVFVGAELAERAIKHLAMSVAHDQWTYCCRHELNHPREAVDADLWVWPFGVALFHLVEDLEFPSLASLAVWHRHVYDEQVTWVNQMAGSLFRSSAQAQYAMPLNWLVRPIWSNSQLVTAIKILSMPRILLHRTGDADTADTSELAQAELVERSLLGDGFDQPDLAEFGVKGISVGVASWSGVVYYPTALKRALSEAELVACELTVQAVWSYCDWLRSEVEAGNDPDVRSEHGWRLLRALRSIVTNPRPEESPQMYPMRTAILETSGIIEHLKQAMETLREIKVRA